MALGAIEICSLLTSSHSPSSGTYYCRCPLWFDWRSRCHLSYVQAHSWPTAWDDEPHGSTCEAASSSGHWIRPVATYWVSFRSELRSVDRDLTGRESWARSTVPCTCAGCTWVAARSLPDDCSCSVDAFTSGRVADGGANERVARHLVTDCRRRRCACNCVGHFGFSSRLLAVTAYDFNPRSLYCCLGWPVGRHSRCRESVFTLGETQWFYGVVRQEFICG